MPPGCPGVLPVGNLRQHPPQHVVAIPEVMLQCRPYMCRNQHEQQHDEPVMGALGHSEQGEAGLQRQAVERHLRPGQEPAEVKQSGRRKRRPHDPPAEGQRHEADVEQDMRDVRDERLPAQPVGVVHRAGNEDAPPGAEERQQQDRQPDGAVHLVGADFVPARHQKIGIETPAELEQHECRHDPVERYAHRRVAILFRMPFGPGSQLLQHQAADRPSCRSQRPAISSAATR